MRSHVSWTLVLVATALTGCASNPTAPAGDAGSDAGSDAGIDTTEPPPLTQGTSTVAGTSVAGSADGSRRVARFANPVNVAYRNGKLYVADFDNNKIRVIDTTSYETSTLISQPGFQRPFGVAFAGDGTLYVATDNDQNGGHSQMSGTIWRIAPGSTTAVVIASAIGRPRGLAVLPDGHLAATDYVHHVIELIDPGNGATSTLAGAWDQSGMADLTGAQARFATPYGIAVRSDGAMVVSDFENHRIRLVTRAGAVTTLAGTGAPGFLDDGPTTSQFRHPLGVAIADNGDIFVSDTDNYRIRRITGAAVQTIAGSGVAGYLDADDPLASQLYGLEGLALVGDGSMLYIADGSRGEALPYNRIRQVARHW